MATLSMHTGKVSLRTAIGIDIRDMTDPLTDLVSESGITDGHLSATIIGSTGSLTTIEHEPGVVADLKRAITRMAPTEMTYEHEKAWHDGNGHSHVQAALMGPSINVPIRKGRLSLATGGRHQP